VSVQSSKPTPIKQSRNEDNVVFSFELLDFNEYFNIDCNCPKWFLDLMEMLRSISAVTRRTFKTDQSFRNGTYRIHNHENVNPPIQFPVNNVDMKQVEQIRISASKGGIHGFMIENVFYVVWLDPQHNMYPNERYGGLIKIKPPTNCCGWRDEELQRLQKENQEYRELFDKL